MRVLIAALLLSISTPAFADNIAGCEAVLMEKIKQEDSQGVTEIASFRPAADFIASAYDKDTEVLREIDGLPIRAIMCKRKSVVPGEGDFPIVATGIPFMISQNFDSSETGLTTIYFKDGEFRSTYKGPELSAKTEAEMKVRLKSFNAKPHDLAEKEQAMQDKAQAEPKLDEANSESELTDVSIEKSKTTNVASEDELLGVASEDELIGISKDETGTLSTKDSDIKDDIKSESVEEKDAPAKEKMESISPEEHEELK